MKAAELFKAYLAASEKRYEFRRLSEEGKVWHQNAIEANRTYLEELKQKLLSYPA